MKQYVKNKWRHDTFIENTYISTDLLVFFRVKEEEDIGVLYKRVLSSFVLYMCNKK